MSSLRDKRKKFSTQTFTNTNRFKDKIIYNNFSQNEPKPIDVFFKQDLFRTLRYFFVEA